MNERHTEIDQTLKSYLDGSDGISDAYRNLGDPTPPAALDAHILAASRTAVETASTRTMTRPPRHALAASFMVGTLATMLFFSQREGTQLGNASDAIAAFSSAADSFAQKSAAEPPALSARNAEREVLEVRGSLAPSTDSTPITVTGSRISREGAREITVTGSLAPAAGATAGYRDAQESWVTYMRELSAHIASAQGAYRDMLGRQLDEEKRLFAAEYSGANLDALLAAPAGN